MSLESLLRRKARTVNSTSSGLSSTRRISTSCDIDHLLVFCSFLSFFCVAFRRSEGEEKRCPFVQFRLRPNLPAVFANDALNNCQTHSRSFKVTRFVQPLKNPEELAYILHLEAHTVVPDKKHTLVVLSHLSNFNHGVFPFTRVFHCI